MGFVSFSLWTSYSYGHSLAITCYPFLQSNGCCIVPKLIIEAPIQPLIVTAKSLTFLQGNDIPLSSNTCPLVVVNVIQILACKPILVLEWVLWEAISWCGTISVGALVVRTGMRREKLCIFLGQPSPVRTSQEDWRSIINLPFVRV